jgi:hypothetical protein
MNQDDVSCYLLIIGLVWFIFSFFCLLWARKKRDTFGHLVGSGLFLILLGSVGGVVPNALLSLADKGALIPGIEHTISYLSNIMLIASAATGANIMVHAIVNK